MSHVYLFSHVGLYVLSYLLNYITSLYWKLSENYKHGCRNDQPICKNKGRNESNETNNLRFFQNNLGLVFHTTYCCIFHSCYLLLLFPLLHFPPLLSTPAFSTPAYSTRAVYSCFFHSCIFHSRIFSAPMLVSTPDEHLLKTMCAGRHDFWWRRVDCVPPREVNISVLVTWHHWPITSLRFCQPADKSAGQSQSQTYFLLYRRLYHAYLTETFNNFLNILIFIDVKVHSHRIRCIADLRCRCGMLRRFIRNTSQYASLLSLQIFLCPNTAHRRSALHPVWTQAKYRW